ncbi:hypothetical protein A7D00_2792 [Trichophyton violaceum]|uniref:FCP1 homology domain-containing protein n=1 Tax=Trichophyton violaceum TaxID=34388 RepID=A0A178FL45_TRIVO|nr:hypothetical protein A7D00_2792 [Trichophyton violaceum]
MSAPSGVPDSSVAPASHTGPSDMPQDASPSALETTEQPKKKRSFLRIPSRSSSKKNKEHSQSEDTNREGTGASLSTSQSNLTGSHSKASSTRSRHAQPLEQAGAHIDSKNGGSRAEHDPKSDRKQRGSLWSFLSCCRAPKDDDGEDMASLPPKQTVKPHSLRTTQPISEKADAGVAESGSADRKDDADVTTEKPAIKIFDEQSAPLGENSVVAAVDEKAAVATKQEDEEESTLSGRDSNTHHQTEPVIPESSRLDPVHVSSEESGASNSLATGQTEKPTETSTTIPEQQNRSDETDMRDQYPIASADEPATEANHQIVHQTTLPPPPPLDLAYPQPAPDKPVPPVPSVQSEKQKWLLPPIQDHFSGRKCLVLDLDETLVHSSFKVLDRADFTIPVEIEGQYHNIYVIKRPGVDQFMKRVGELYEVVVFTASVSKYGDPLLDKLDIHKVVHHRLFRDSCYNHQGNYVKDLSQVGRDLKETIIIDNSPTSYIFHPKHAIPISSWFSDAHDNELLDLIPVLEDLAHSQVRDVSLVLDVAL